MTERSLTRLGHIGLDYYFQPYKSCRDILGSFSSVTSTVTNVTHVLAPTLQQYWCILYQPYKVLGAPTATHFRLLHPRYITSIDSSIMKVYIVSLVFACLVLALASPVQLKEIMVTWSETPDSVLLEAKNSIIAAVCSSACYGKLVV